MIPPVEPLTPIPTENRDSYFEYRYSSLFDPLEVGGLSVNPSDVLQLDPVAYSEAREGLLTDVLNQFQSSCSEASLRRLERLAQLIPKGGVIPFVGAGASQAAGYPGWASFLLGLCRSTDEVLEAQQLIATGHFEQLASIVRDRIGSNAFDESLDAFDTGGIPGELDYLIVSTFREGLVTTNFDTLLEQALDRVQHPFMPVEGAGNWAGWAREATSLRGMPVLKLHGHYGRSLHRVLLFEEYETEYGEGGATRRDLEHLLSSKTLVFVGCSLGPDRTLSTAKELQGKLPQGSIPKHYAFIAGDDEREARELFLSERGIFPIWYLNDDGDHQMLCDMLWWLRAQQDGKGV